MDYSKIKKIDEESLQKMTEGAGPVDECLCNLLYTPDGRGGINRIRSSIKKVLASIGGRKRGEKQDFGEGVDIPLTFTKGKKGGIFSTKEVVKRNSSCGKCGCDKEKIVLKHSMANIRIVTPDISSICPCPEDCLPDAQKLQNNIKVTIEHVKTFGSDDETDGTELDSRRTVSEPEMTRKKSQMSMVDEKYDDFEYESDREDSDDEKSSEKPSDDTGEPPGEKK